MRRFIALAAITLGLTACGSDTPEQPREEDRALQRAIQAPLDKARATEEALEKARQQQDAELKEQGGAT
jgi:hypothetical protein